jgi:tRNA dimethylallyltransferase
MDLKSKIVLIAGPTASGKSKIAINLAKKIKGEIVNADSMQVYKQLKILTARPSDKNKKNIKHYLFGIIDVRKRFSTGQWLKECIKIINLIRKRKKIPIIVGGTGLYFKALVDGLVRIPKFKPSEKNKILKLHNKLGQKQFFKKLVKLDPVSKKFVNPNDVNRSIRAYEVKILTKKSLYKWFKDTKTFFDKNDFVMTYVDYPRDKLIINIKNRIDRMFDLGAIKEVKKFNLIKINKLNSVNHVIGIKEINSYLSKKAELSDIKEQILIKTRQYAKRQSTWSRGHMSDWYKIDPKSKNPFKKILK